MLVSPDNSISQSVSSLEEHFQKFRENIIGQDSFVPVGEREIVRMLYADWTASGRCYRPLEEKLMNEVMPFIANTHTETNYVGSFITEKYLEARDAIKNHVNANDGDVLISYGSGMTDVLNKLQRILGLRAGERFQSLMQEKECPVVFVSHMEHHSNHTSWLETICDVVVVPPGENGLVSLREFEDQILLYPHRKKIVAITACSNVTGIETPYRAISDLIHTYEGICIVDFACSAPYVEIDMHPNSHSYLDAICFSPHKFLGGPGSSGILIFNKKLHQNNVPDVSGGGTVDWTNPWGGRKYVDRLEEREDGGTPAILQTIRAAEAILLKEQMGISNILHREEELMEIIWEELCDIDGLQVLAGDVSERLGIISFCIDDLHFNEAVGLLNDQFGIQVRGGCSCAGTYGHYLLNIDLEESKRITDEIDSGNNLVKPGWVRLSIHPTMTNDEAHFIVEAVRTICKKAQTN